MFPSLAISCFLSEQHCSCSLLQSHYLGLMMSCQCMISSRPGWSIGTFYTMYCTLCIIVSLHHHSEHVEYPLYYGKRFSLLSRMIFHWSKRRKMWEEQRLSLQAKKHHSTSLMWVGCSGLFICEILLWSPEEWQVNDRAVMHGFFFSADWIYCFSGIELDIITCA